LSVNVSECMLKFCWRCYLCCTQVRGCHGPGRAATHCNSSLPHDMFKCREPEKYWRPTDVLYGTTVSPPYWMSCSRAEVMSESVTSTFLKKLKFWLVTCVCCFSLSLYPEMRSLFRSCQGINPSTLPGYHSQPRRNSHLGTSALLLVPLGAARAARIHGHIISPGSR
jgi:hypothetical protein